LIEQQLINNIFHILVKLCRAVFLKGSHHQPWPFFAMEKGQDLCCSKGRSKPREALHLGISRDYFIGRQQNDVRFVVICWDFQVVQHIEFLKALSNIVNVNAHVGHVNFFKLWEELMSHPGCLKPQRKGFSSISW